MKDLPEGVKCREREEVGEGAENNPCNQGTGPETEETASSFPDVRPSKAQSY